jgi:hypothetical protein
MNENKENRKKFAVSCTSVLPRATSYGAAAPKCRKQQTSLVLSSFRHQKQQQTYGRRC